MKIYTLTGNFDFYITPFCTLSCTGCGAIDYKEIGNAVGDTMSMENLKELVNTLLKLNLKLQSLTFMGGEPTIHKQYYEFAKYISTYKGVVYDELILHTNGTNINRTFLNSLKYFDTIKFTFYEVSLPIKDSLEESGIKKFIEDQGVKVYIKTPKEFFIFGKKQKDLQYSQESNWQRCFMKDTCRVITNKELYRCDITYYEKKESLKLDDREKIIKFIENQDTPLNKCKTCPFPPKTMKWKTNNLKRDQRNTNIAIEKIKKLQLEL